MTFERLKNRPIWTRKYDIQMEAPLEMKTFYLFTGIIGVIFMAGCTHAGPYVTDITYDGRGNLIITKDSVRFCPFTGPFLIGRVSSGRMATTSVVRIIPYSENIDKNIPHPNTETHSSDEKSKKQ